MSSFLCILVVYRTSVPETRPIFFFDLLTKRVEVLTLTSDLKGGLRVETN